MALTIFFQSCWPMTDYIGRSSRNSNPVMTSSTGGAKGFVDHRLRAPPASTVQLLTLHQHRANNRWIGRLIELANFKDLQQHSDNTRDSLHQLASFLEVLPVQLKIHWETKQAGCLLPPICKISFVYANQEICAKTSIYTNIFLLIIFNSLSL